MSTKVTFSFEVTRWGVEMEGTCTGKYTPGDPGRISGPPENCYPPEAAEFEPTTITITNIGGVTLVEPMPIDHVNDFYEDFQDDFDDLAGRAYEDQEDAAQEDRADARRDDQRFERPMDRDDVG